MWTPTTREQRSRARSCPSAWCSSGASSVLAILAGLREAEKDARQLRELAQRLEGEPLGAVAGLCRTLEERRKKRSRDPDGPCEAPT